MCGYLGYFCCSGKVLCFELAVLSQFYVSILHVCLHVFLEVSDSTLYDLSKSQLQKIHETLPSTRWSSLVSVLQAVSGMSFRKLVTLQFFSSLSAFMSLTDTSLCLGGEAEIPCEFCGEPFPADMVVQHQVSLFVPQRLPAETDCFEFSINHDSAANK